MIKFSKSELQKAYNLCKSAVNKVNVLPIFSNIRIRSFDNKFEMIAANQMYQIIANGDADGDSIDLCFDADKFGLMMSAASDEIVMSVSGGVVSVKSGKSKYNFQTLPGIDMPIIDGISGDLYHENLSHVVAGVHLNAPVKHLRYVLNGVSVFIGDGKIKSFASDGFSMAFASIDCESDSKASFIVPADVAAIIAANECEYFCVEGRRPLVKFESSTLISKLIDGNPPNFQSTIPTNADYFFSVDRRQLSDIASIAKKSGDMALKMVVTDGNISASTSSGTFSIETEIESDCNSDLTVSFLPSMLMMLCKIIETEVLKICYTNSGDTNKYICSDGDKSFVMMSFLK